LWDNAQAVSVGREERAEQIEDIPALALNSGAQVFEARCSTCHQPNAVGVRSAIPPLAGSRFVAADPAVIVQILLHGIDGPIDVGGKVFDGHMPSFASVLSDAQLARVATHVRQTWGGDDQEITPAFVTAQRDRFPGRGAWRGGEELARVVDPGLAPQPPVGPVRIFSFDDPGVMRLVTEGRGEAWACASCHGAAGEGGANVPRLAGLPEGYIVKQLQDYVSGRRRNETMQTVAGALSDADRRGLARYYSALRTPSTARPELGGGLKRGEQLALYGDWSKNLPACFSCHGPSGFGVAPNFPSLAAQHPAYTASQLAAWVGGQRDNSDVQLMNEVARNLSDADRRAIADYLATLPPVPAASDDERR
jgi:cytochrome c553